MQEETRQQLRADGWSEEKILRAELREIERTIRGTNDAAILRTLGRRRREIRRALDPQFAYDYRMASTPDE